LGSETARVHHAAWRRSGCVAARSARLQAEIEAANAEKKAAAQKLDKYR
jgi:hypothetical protein